MPSRNQNNTSLLFLFGSNHVCAASISHFCDGLIPFDYHWCTIHRNIHIYLVKLSTRKWQYLLFNSVRFGKGKQKNMKHFSDMPHIVAIPRWLLLTLRIPHGSKIETCYDFSENSVKLIILILYGFQKCIV